MSVSTDKCIAVYLRDKLNKEQKSMKEEGENTMRRVNIRVLFNVMIGNEIYREWRLTWRKLKNITKEGGKWKKGKLYRKVTSK